MVLVGAVGADEGVALDLTDPVGDGERIGCLPADDILVQSRGSQSVMVWAIRRQLSTKVGSLISGSK